MSKNMYKKVISMILAAVMVLGVPCGVYANTVETSTKVYESKTVTATSGVAKTNTTYSNGSCTAVSGASSSCHISFWLVDKYGKVATNTNCYTTTSEKQALVYKSGYGMTGYLYYACARIVTGSATTSTTLKYKLTP